jgi:hypothetical protein
MLEKQVFLKYTISLISDENSVFSSLIKGPAKKGKRVYNLDKFMYEKLEL